MVIIFIITITIIKLLVLPILCYIINFLLLFVGFLLFFCVPFRIKADQSTQTQPIPALDYTIGENVETAKRNKLFQHVYLN